MSRRLKWLCSLQVTQHMRTHTHTNSHSHTHTHSRAALALFLVQIVVVCDMSLVQWFSEVELQLHVIFFFLRMKIVLQQSLKYLCSTFFSGAVDHCPCLTVNNTTANWEQQQMFVWWLVQQAEVQDNTCICELDKKETLKPVSVVQSLAVSSKWLSAACDRWLMLLIYAYVRYVKWCWLTVWNKFLIHVFRTNGIRTD